MVEPSLAAEQAKMLKELRVARAWQGSLDAAGGSSQWMEKVINNHGDRTVSPPKNRVGVGSWPLPNGVKPNFMAYKMVVILATY